MSFEHSSSPTHSIPLNQHKTAQNGFLCHPSPTPTSPSNPTPSLSLDAPRFSPCLALPALALHLAIVLWRWVVDCGWCWVVLANVLPSVASGHFIKRARVHVVSPHPSAHSLGVGVANCCDCFLSPPWRLRLTPPSIYEVVNHVVIRTIEKTLMFS